MGGIHVGLKRVELLQPLNQLIPVIVGFAKDDE
jgi:hypothetical protein